MRRYKLGFLIMVCLTLLLSVAPVAYGQNSVTHVVQPGENLYRIALRYGVTVQAVAQANNITNPNLIYVGQSLTIPGGTTGGSSGPSQPPPTTTPPTTTPPPATGTYTVAAGDNLSRIAQRFSTTVQAIAQANNITNVNLIFVGQVLNVPGATATPGGGTATPQPGGGTPQPGGGTPPAGGFELGGHVLNYGGIDQMRQMRMTWAKVQIRWQIGQNTDSAAAAINEAHLNGFKVLLGIVGDPGQMAQVGLDAYIPQFAQYVGNVASLGPEAIEVWNEPNISVEWPEGQISPQGYTRLLQASYQSIKAAKSSVLVISGAPAPTGFFGGGCSGAGCDDAPFLRGMAQAGAAQYMDCIGAHYNEGLTSPTQRSGDPRQNPNHYTRYYGTMLDTYYNAFGGAKPVCWTELGYISMEGLSNTMPAGFEWASNNTLQEHAIWLGEAVRLARGSGRVRLLIVWNVNFSATGGTGHQEGYSVIRPGGSCPACAPIATAMQ